MSTDASGQLRSAPSIYIADAASLPEIPAGSYTLWVNVQDGAVSPGGIARSARRSLDFKVAAR